MSLKDLQEHGILLPKEEWGVHDLHTSVNKLALVAAMLLGLVSVVLMYVGGGTGLTFVGTIMFLAFMVWITQISMKAINVQAEQFAEEREQVAEEISDTPPTE